MQTVGSDYHFVTCFIQVSYIVYRTLAQQPFRAVDWHQLNNNPLLRHHYSIEVKNRHDALLEENDAEADDGNFMESITTTVGWCSGTAAHFPR